MIFSNWDLRLPSFLVAISLFTTGLVYYLEETDLVPMDISLKVPDYTLQKFTTWHWNAQGQLYSMIAAPRMQHYLGQATELTSPVMTFYQQGLATWEVKAERAQVSATGEEIHLQGETIFQQQVAPNFKIVSQEVLVYMPKVSTGQVSENYAETAALATVIGPQGLMQSVGMRVLMDTQRIYLLSQVVGRYEVP